MKKVRIRKSFDLGSIYITAGLKSFIEENEISMFPYLSLHAQCDWGDLCAEDWQLNNEAIDCGDRILSVYNVRSRRVYIITEADRSATTMLFADEY